MRKLKLEMQVSLDGFTADADGAVDWMVWPWSAEWGWDEALRRRHIALTTSSDCILLSRRMAEEGFHDHWEAVAGNPADPQSAFAQPISEMRKVVFTRTLEASRWPRTELARGELADEVGRLKRQDGKDLIAYGGPTFASALLEAGLIDELYIFVNPVALGRGRPMFKAIRWRVPLRLVESTPYPCGVVVQEYKRAA